ncbi:MAG: penicillin-binding protein 2 [Anaerolineaceae bacterium]
MKVNVFNVKGSQPWRYTIFYVVVGLIFSFYAIKLIGYQVIDQASYTAIADENRTKQISDQTLRGKIVDRNGFVLAENAPSYDVVIVPADLPSDKGSKEEIFRGLSALIGVPITNGTLTDATAKLFTPCQSDFGIKEIVTIGDTNAPYTAVKIKCNIPEKTAMTISEKGSNWSGVGIQISPVRSYPTGSLTAAIVGFLGPITAENKDKYTAKGFIAGTDKVGFAGAEYSLDGYLLGKNGQKIIEVDNAGKQIRNLETPITAVSGDNVVLTIDTRLQNAAESALVTEMNWWNTYLGKIKSQNGAVIAMNPKTGEILALVSYPSYENNRMSREIPSYYFNQLNQDPLKPLFNHAISAEAPPGSVYKLAAAVGALNEKVITPEQEIACPGSITVVNTYSVNDPGSVREYASYDRNGHGTCDFIKGVSLSDDVYFYKIGGGYETEVPNGGLNAWRLEQYSRALGYGQTSGIELPGEASGLVPNPTWKRINQTENWSVGDTYIDVIGQGYVLATPLQVLESMATIAFDGKHMKPTIIKEILDSEGNVVKSFEPTLLWDITKDPVITVLDSSGKPTGKTKVVDAWAVKELQIGLREVVVSGTAKNPFKDLDIPSAGKTGTAEYCDDVAQEKGLCITNNWPTHSWYVGYAPFDNPEIVVVAFVYNGGEGASVAAPIVEQVLQTYFDLKANDAANGTSNW